MLILLACLSAITIFGQSTADSLQNSSDSISEALEARAPAAPAAPSPEQQCGKQQNKTGAPQPIHTP